MKKHKKIFFDTEFHEYHKQPRYSGFKIGKPIPTIDFISIGMIDESERTYYAVSKDFNVEDAWFSSQVDSETNTNIYWLRENVLKLIFNEMLDKETRFGDETNLTFNLKDFKSLLEKYGKSNKQISEEIIDYVYEVDEDVRYSTNYQRSLALKDIDYIDFFAFFGSYDWVVFAQLFGKMIDLPEKFPMYVHDLKQIFDEKIEQMEVYYHKDILLSDNIEKDRPATFDEKIKCVKSLSTYPSQEGEHNALNDAVWNLFFYEFLNEEIKCI